jgi:hypothetical protein
MFLVFVFDFRRWAMHTNKCDLLSLVVKKCASSSNSYAWGCKTGKANLSNSISRHAVSFSSGFDPTIYTSKNSSKKKENFVIFCTIRQKFIIIFSNSELIRNLYLQIKIKTKKHPLHLFLQLTIHSMNLFLRLFKFTWNSNWI